MSHAKDWRSFPPAFVRLLREASVREVRITLPDAKEAKRMEGKLHAFVGLLHRAEARAKDDAELTELDNLSRRVQIKAKANVLVCVPRELEPDNLLVEAALDAALGVMPAPTLDGVKMSSEMQEMFNKTLTNPP